MFRGYIDAIERLDEGQYATTLGYLRRLRDRAGRLFLIGNGGGAGHASHAAADFRKIARIQSYAWGDNTSDLTAYTNDEGWSSTIVNWLRDSSCTGGDAIFVFSVGGGTPYVSQNITEALTWAKGIVPILGVVGAAGGEVARHATSTIIVPSLSTPIIEGVQAVVWHQLAEDLRQ